MYYNLWRKYVYALYYAALITILIIVPVIIYTHLDIIFEYYYDMVFVCIICIGSVYIIIYYAWCLINYYYIIYFARCMGIYTYILQDAPWTNSLFCLCLSFPLTSLSQHCCSLFITITIILLLNTMHQLIIVIFDEVYLTVIIISTPLNSLKLNTRNGSEFE